MNCDWDTYVKQTMSPQVALGPEKFIPVLESKLRVCKRKKNHTSLKTLKIIIGRWLKKLLGGRGKIVAIADKAEFCKVPVQGT